MFHFPPADLAFSLVDKYFRYINLHFPLLHKPTFTQLVEEHGFILNEGERRVHGEGPFEKEGFAEVYLLVCALGSWYSDDPRCLLKAEPDSVRQPCSDSDKGERRGMPGSAGWKWFNQVQLMRNRSLFTPPTLEDLQVYAVSALFYAFSSPSPMRTHVIALSSVSASFFRATGIVDHGWHRYTACTGCWYTSTQQYDEPGTDAGWGTLEESVLGARLY